MKRPRTTIAALTLSASALVGLLTMEGWCGKACIPVPGDKLTLGFGSTEGVKLGDSIDPVTAVNRAHRDIVEFESALKQCVKVPLYQHEYDFAVSFSYNVGAKAFCNSTLVKKWNAGDYVGGCNEVSRWVYVKGRKVQGLVNRREKERKLCLGLTQP